MDLFPWLVTFCWLAFVAYLFLRSFLSKDPGKKSVSVALFGYIYIYTGMAQNHRDFSEFWVFVGCVAFSAIYVLILTVMRLLKAMGLRKG